MWLLLVLSSPLPSSLPFLSSLLLLSSLSSLPSGGEGGIRTHETLTGLPALQASTFVHSVTSPRHDSYGSEESYRSNGNLHNTPT